MGSDFFGGIKNSDLLRKLGRCLRIYSLEGTLMLINFGRYEVEVGL